MDILNLASIFGRNEFFIRRLHSLLGLMPVGGYLAFHLATNAAIIDGPETYQRRADQIHAVGPTTLFFLEWFVVFLPMIFHGLVGLVIVTRGKRNVWYYPYRENLRYTLQRWMGVIAFLFIAYHVFHMRGWFEIPWWQEHVTRPLGGGKFESASAALTAGAAIQASRWIVAVYALGTLAAVYHLANGVWTFGITWGAWTSQRAQNRANLPCLILGIALVVIGLGALLGMLNVTVPPPSPS
jgi:succinate dehydrogenase / fumarate reductase, cytochrome b subunit